MASSKLIAEIILSHLEQEELENQIIIIAMSCDTGLARRIANALGAGRKTSERLPTCNSVRVRYSEHLSRICDGITSELTKRNLSIPSDLRGYVVEVIRSGVQEKKSDSWLSIFEYIRRFTTDEIAQTDIRWTLIHCLWK